jgi:hypothetical protein
MLLPERLVAFLFVAQAYDGWQILPWGHAHAMDGTIPHFDCAVCGTARSEDGVVSVRLSSNTLRKSGHSRTAAQCHERTNAPQQKSHHSIAVGTREQHGRRYGTTSTIFRSTS